MADDALYLSANDPAWTQLQSRFLLIRLDARGRLLGEAGHSTLPEKERLLRAVEKAGNVSACFEIPVARGMAAAWESQRFFRCRPGFFPEDAEEQFVTSLPVYLLSLNRRGEEGYLGVISPLRVAPNLFFHETGGICYADKKGGLCGYNGFFRDLFQSGPSDGKPMLGAALDGLISPSPASIRETALSVDNQTLFPEYPVLFDGKGRPDQLSHRVPPVDLPANAVECGLVYEMAGGDAPLISIRPFSRNRGSEGNEAYLLGPSAARPSTVVVKKQGCVIADGSGCGLSAPGIHRIAWRLRNGTFRLLIDGVEAFAYHDFDFPSMGAAQIGIVIRPGARTVLKRLTIKAGPAGLPMPGRPCVTRLKHEPGRAFVIHMIYHPVLASAFPGITGYTFHEVSRLTADLSRLNGLYAAEQAEADRLRKRLSGAGLDNAPRLLGESSAMRRVRGQAELLAGSDAALAIEGETGTGKEVLANFIHGRSAFGAGPFIKVDCSSLPGTLLESELFGVERGAFTGAVESRPGKFEQAENGTLFLDEINNLPLTVQAKLLGFLQDLTVVRLGGRRARRLSLRVIAASNIPLKELVRKGLFREDLYYRIQVATVVMPPLRERKEDIPELAAFFLKGFAENYGRGVKTLSPAASARLMEWTWPGNVRELRNEIQRAVLFARGAEIGAGELSVGSAARSADEPLPRLALAKEEFEALLRKRRGNLNALARELKCARSTVYYNLRKFGLVPARFR